MLVREPRAPDHEELVVPSAWRVYAPLARFHRGHHLFDGRVFFRAPSVPLTRLV